jgi:AcrR family transcriptional regulator
MRKGQGSPGRRAVGINDGDVATLLVAVDDGPVLSSGVSSPQGVRPPQQARSRAALQRLLASAEYVLVNDGIDEFTIARVAEHAGVSVGGVYRRFEGKDQLIDAVRQDLMNRLEAAVLEALDTAPATLEGIVGSFVDALGRTLSDSGRLIPAMMEAGRGGDAPERGMAMIAGLQERFLLAARPYHKQIRHPNPKGALLVAFRSAMSMGAYRAASADVWPDPLSWSDWSHEIADMTTLYLTTKR